MTAPKPSITAREPDGWRDGFDDDIHLADRDHLPNLGCSPSMHTDDEPLWLVSADDLTAHDEAVRREAVIAELTGAAEEWDELERKGYDALTPAEIAGNLRARVMVLRAEATPHADDTEAGS